jgi:hypothetical protein
MRKDAMTAKLTETEIDRNINDIEEEVHGGTVLWSEVLT